MPRDEEEVFKQLEETPYFEIHLGHLEDKDGGRERPIIIWDKSGRWQGWVRFQGRIK
jgi:hypothetical protein